MAHCSKCKATHPGTPDGHWEDLYEGVKLCSSCVESVATTMIAMGEVHKVHPKLRERLEKELWRNNG